MKKPLPKRSQLQLSPQSNQALLSLCGEWDSNLRYLSKCLNVEIDYRGFDFHLTGNDVNKIKEVERVIAKLYKKCLNDDTSIGEKQIHWALNQGNEAKKTGHPQQEALLSAINNHSLTFALGPAGTGKTYMSVMAGIIWMKKQQNAKLVLLRPALEAGEKLGFLPGDMCQKVDPYLRPLYDALDQILGNETAQHWQDRGLIEVIPLAFIRGRTFSNSFVILDEGQNATQDQMLMFLTRLGLGSKMVVTGDPSQNDLPRGMSSGLRQATELLSDETDIAICRLNEEGIMRHPVVKRIIKRYDSI